MQKYLHLAYKYSFIGVLKQPLYTKLYLNALLPLIGFIHLGFSRKISKTVYPLLALALIAFVHLIFDFSASSAGRSLQLLGLFLFFNMCLDYFSLDKIKDVAKYLSFLSIFILIIEIIFFDPAGYNRGVLPRYHGILGETNYTSQLTTVLSLINLYFNSYWAFACSFLSIFGSNSRTSFLVIISFVLLFVILRKYKHLYRPLLIFSLTFSFLYPLFLSNIADTLRERGNTFQKFNEISSNRLSIHSTYSQMVKDSPLGIGYFNSVKAIQKKEYLGKTTQIAEAHNIFIHIAVEFGVIGLIIFLFALFQILKGVQNPILMASSISYLILLFFLNGLHEYILYMFLTLCIKDSKIVDQLSEK